MHFRHILITGFIAGAAMLVPDMVFAEKGENLGKGPQTVAAEQANVPDKANNVRISEKSPAQPAVQNLPVQKQVVQKPAQAKPKETPTDAGKVKWNASSSKKEQKAAQPKKTKASTTEKPNQVNHKQKHSNNQNKKGTLKSIHNKDQYAKETERRFPILEEKVEPPKEYKTPSNVKKEAKTEIRKMPPAKKDENDSSQKERYPKGDNLPNPPSRTKASGGPSGDRTSYGNTNNFLSDKWFYWDVTFQLNLLQHFTSRVAVFQSQWVNAPPSPPPLKAPAFLPYTDAIVTDHVNEKGANDENEK
ncbi:hypothetical protein [Mesobacillus subterraneus]|uniref:hypothetical protein n=1 Tax=Mesobacillus subterraneus TaxID=285983 RepID=UPI001CFE3345|nr:hypothetical protein [Mesobacillus subterraneus]